MKRLTWINLIAGIWLIFAPYAISLTPALSSRSISNAVIVGVLLVASSLWIVAAPTAPVGAAWFQAACGIWLIITPFVIGYGGLTPLGRNSVIAGTIVVVIGLMESRAFAGLPRPS